MFEVENTVARDAQLRVVRCLESLTVEHQMREFVSISIGMSESEFFKEERVTKRIFDSLITSKRHNSLGLSRHENLYSI